VHLHLNWQACIHWHEISTNQKLKLTSEFQAKWNISQCCSFIIDYALVKKAKKSEIALHKGTTKLTQRMNIRKAIAIQLNKSK